MQRGRTCCYLGILAVSTFLCTDAFASTDFDATPDPTHFLDFQRDYSNEGINPYRNPYNVQARFRNIINTYLEPLPDIPVSESYEDAKKIAAKNRDDYQATLIELLRSKQVDNLDLSDFPTLKSYAIDDCFHDPESYFYKSNNAFSALAFDRAFFADATVKEGYRELALTRDKMLTIPKYDPIITDSNKKRLENIEQLKNDIEQLKTKQTGDYPKYLEAALSFYSQNYDAAATQFTALTQSTSPWLKETALYMRGRIPLIQSQTRWDGESDPTGKINLDQLAQAEKQFDSYLTAYPNGLYTNSISNLKRKIYFLRGDHANLARALKETLLRSYEEARRDKSRIPHFYAAVREFYRHFDAPIDYANDPALVIVFGVVADAAPSLETIKPLQMHPERYRDFPGLERLLEAAVYDRNQRYDDVTSLLEGSAQTSLSLNEKALLAHAYTATHKPEKALALWHEMQAMPHHNENEYAIEFELAYLHANQNDYLGLVRDGGITDISILAGFATYYANEKELENALSDKEVQPGPHHVVELELMRRYLLTKQYRKLAALDRRIKDPGLFREIEKPVDSLARNPKNVKALLEVATFIYNKSLDPTSALQSEKDAPFPDENGLLALPDRARCKRCIDTAQLNAKYDYPYRYFKTVQQHFEQSGETSEVEAQALHYMVECFHEGYRSRTCLWGQKEPNAGKAAFARLHKLYPKSEWTKKTPYYYELDQYYYSDNTVTAPDRLNPTK